MISKWLWLSRSADLSTPDIFLWGYMNDSAYRNNPQNLDELKTYIRNITADISPMTLRTES
jgi:hypothetical protein